MIHRDPQTSDHISVPGGLLTAQIARPKPSASDSARMGDPFLIMFSGDHSVASYVITS